MNPLPAPANPLQPPFVVTVVTEADTPMTAAALRAIHEQLTIMIGRTVAPRIVQRATDLAAPLRGFQELIAVLTSAPRLVVVMKPRPWDQWLRDRGIPVLNWPSTPDEAGPVVEQARSLEWVKPVLAGVVADEIAQRAPDEINLNSEGVPPLHHKAGWDIGRGSLAALLEAPPRYVMRLPVDVALPVPADSIVGLRPGQGASVLAKTVAFRLAYHQPKAAQQPDADTYSALRSRTIGRLTLLDPVDSDVASAASLLWSCYRHIATRRVLVSSPEGALVIALRQLGWKGLVRVRQHPATLRVVQPEHAMERLLLEAEFGPLKWEMVEPVPSVKALPVVITIETGDWNSPAALRALVDWVATSRQGACDQTWIRGSAEVQELAKQAGMSVDADAAPARAVYGRLRPEPLWSSVL